MLLDKKCGFIIFPVFVAILTIKGSSSLTCGIIGAIGARVIASLNAADLHSALGLIDISPSIFVTDLASFALATLKLRAGPAIRTTTANFHNRHGLLLIDGWWAAILTIRDCFAVSPSRRRLARYIPLP